MIEISLLTLPDDIIDDIKSHVCSACSLRKKESAAKYSCFCDLNPDDEKCPRSSIMTDINDYLEAISTEVEKIAATN